MQTKTTTKYHLTLVRMVSSKNLQTMNEGEDMEKKEIFYTVGDTAIIENSMEIPLKTRDKSII